MGLAHEAAREWLKNSYHRDMWRLTADAGEQVLAQEAKIPPTDPDPEDLEKLTRLHGRAEGMEEILDGALRAWIIDEKLPGLEKYQLEEAILELWEK